MPELETHEIQSPGATLADEMYTEPEQVEEKPEETPEVTPEIDETVETEEVQEAESTETIVEEGDEIEVTSVEQLAEHLETDPDWIRGLKVTEKVNGEPVEVSLSDALRTHRQVKAGDQYLADAKTKSKQILESTTQDKQIVASSAATLAALLEEAEAAVSGGMKDEDWARLRREDPAEYSAKKEEQRERQARLDDLKSRASAAVSETTGQMAARQKLYREQALPQEREVFMSLVPEWNDQEVAERESAEINEYLQSHGHSPEEIEVACYNGKLLAYVRNSMLYERSKNKIDATKKKVVKIPKVLKPGKTAEDAKPKAGDDDPVSILYGSP